jgi:aminoglycoside phosphotransferase (APT) family kinase protein
VFVETRRRGAAATKPNGASTGIDLSKQLAALIARSLPDVENLRAGEINPVLGGNARKAYSFEVTFHRHGRDERLPCIMLTQPAGRQIDTDVAQEFHVLHSLNGKGTLAPTAVAVDATGEVAGAPAIVLERLPGKASARDFLDSPDPSAARGILEHLAVALARLHAVEVEPAVIEPRLKGLSAPEIARRRVSAWHEKFLAQRMEPLPVMCGLFEWAERNVPDPQHTCLVHGDVRPGNFLYDGAELTGLLDWEMAHIGDPLEDLAWIYRPLWSPQRFLALREFARRYALLAGREVAWVDVLYYRIFSELKFATISLTASRAFSAGSTLNLRHIDRAAKVAPCLQRCLDWIDLHSEEVCRAQADSR